MLWFYCISSINVIFCSTIPLCLYYSLYLSFCRDVFTCGTIMKRITSFVLQHLLIVRTTTQWNYRYLVCGWSKWIFLWYFMIMRYLNQWFCKCKVSLKIWMHNAMFWTLDSLCLQVMTVLSFVSRVLKNDHKVLKLVPSDC